MAKNRDPPIGLRGFLNSMRQLCHVRKVIDPELVVNWLLQKKLVEIDGSNRIVYRFDETDPNA